MRLQTAQHDRRGRLGSALLAAAVLVSVPGILVYQWVQETAPYEPKQESAATVARKDVEPMAEETAPKDGREELEPRKTARPALVGPDGAAVKEDTQTSTDEESDPAPTQIVKVLRAAHVDSSVFYYRTWTASNGAAIEAVYIGHQGDEVLLRDSNGSQHRIPLSRLSDADQELLQRTWESTP